jgi:hypothetical protein
MGLMVRAVNQRPSLWRSDYSSVPYPVLAFFRMGMSGSASFHDVLSGDNFVWALTNAHIGIGFYR